MSRFLIGGGLIALVLPALAQGQAQAQDVYPTIGTETQVQLQNDIIRLPGGKTTQDLVFTGHQQTLLEIDEHWMISNLLSIDQVIPTADGSHTAFSNEGLYVEELYGHWSNDTLTVKGGKFSMNFGRAWAMVPGIYGADFVSDYQIAENWGMEARYALLPYQFGRHTVSLSASMQDDTVLSQSLLTNRGKLSYDMGGPGNTRLPESYVASYDAAGVPTPVGQLGYQFSYADLGRGSMDSGKESRAAVSADLNIPIRTDIDSTLDGRFTGLRLFGEAVRRWNADGLAGLRVDYLTAATELVRGNWVFDASTTERHFTNIGLRGTDHLNQLSVGYNFPFDTTLAVAVANERTQGVNAWYFGVQLAYTFTACDRCLITARHY